ncbi:sugar transferase [Priestia megaterium]|uniref:sugar transferase n=1 Tax=Priestia megaterium TaxID=1404 RepID=UPI00203A9FBA|nr:sugar transferase [Priestia megaterium]MCM3306977.1 sugar transferase [Priestia megaterium]
MRYKGKEEGVLLRKLQLIIKRGIDFLLSLVGLIVLSPIILVVSIMIYFKLGSPIFFIQDRPGKDGKVFKMLKFRTMLNSTDRDGNLLPNEQRYTKFGNFLRKTSVDELPELYNVLKGDMSLVGPRPLLVEYLPLYTKTQARRHEVRPGITGLAQVSGRNAISWEDKFNFDIKYVDKFNLILDIKIILLTVKKVFVQEGINFEKGIKNQKFKGEGVKK